MAWFLLLLTAQASPQDPYTITATLREVPGGVPGGRPALLCEGTTTLPERSRVDFWLFFGEPRSSGEIDRNAVEVREGRFSCTFSVYSPPRNLAGLHSVRVAFDPFLQKPGIPQGIPPVRAEASLRIGTALEAERDRDRWRKTLADEIRTLEELFEEVWNRYHRDKEAGKHDRDGWSRLIRDAEERSHEVLHRTSGVAEYKALNFGDAADVGLEELGDILLHFARFCLAALNNPGHPQTAGALRQTRTTMQRSLQKYHNYIYPQQPDAEALAGLGEDARKILRDALEADEAGRAGARAKFRQIVILLDNRAPATFHEAIIRLAGEAAPFFQALDEDPEKARALREVLDRQIQEILKEVGTLK